MSALALLLLTSCDDGAKPANRGQPPPPPPAAKPATCDGVGRVNDPGNVKFFPKKMGSFCLDPTGSDKGYGEGAKNPLDGICDLVDGECEIYKDFKAIRVVEVHYVDGGGSGSTVDVYLSKFESTEHAYGMFSHRVIGDGDPAIEAAPRKIDGGGEAALGVGNAYLWRGPFLAELTYNDESNSLDQIKARADALLPGFVKELGEKLAGSKELPEVAAKLPTDDLLPLGRRFITTDLLNITGAGPGALGYYRKESRRWRVLLAKRGDEAQAKDVIKTIAATGSSKEKGIGEEAVRIMHSGDGLAHEWLVARRGSWIVGVGDEPRVMREGMTPEEIRDKELNSDDKRKLLREILEKLD